MLVIRSDQMMLLEADAIAAFERRTYEHLLHYFPKHCQLLGETQMRKVIHHGWLRAKRHGLTPECCVRSYIDLMCVLGSGFDSDALLPWARQVLRAQQGVAPIVRGDKLYERAWHYIDQVSRDYQDDGQPTTARFVSELRALGQLSDQELTPVGTPALLAVLNARLQRALPFKYALVGQRRIRLALSLAVHSARCRGLTTERGVAAFLVLRFVLGAEFDRDPLLPWISEILDDPALVDPRARGARLFLESVGFLRRWWDLEPEKGEN